MDDKKSQDNTAVQQPIYPHFILYAQKTGLLQNAAQNPKQYADVQQTYYAGALAALAILEGRGVDLSDNQDVVAELIQFTQSQQRVATAGVNQDLQEGEQTLTPPAPPPGDPLNNLRGKVVKGKPSIVTDLRTDQQKTSDLADKLGMPDLEKL